MKSTGITRRIDDLGRIVIPKEIRKNLKIRDNETLEIFIEDDNIILKKFSSINDIQSALKNYLEVLENITLNNVLITDRYKVICSSENKKEEYLDKEIGQNIIVSIQTKESILSNEKKDVELTLNNEIFTKYYINPIISNGDVLGTIIIFGSKEINENSISAADVISKLIVNSTY